MTGNGRINRNSKRIHLIKYDEISSFHFISDVLCEKQEKLFFLVFILAIEMSTIFARHRKERRENEKEASGKIMNF